jgi:predicted RNase H-like HicB family nuclease
MKQLQKSVKKFGIHALVWREGDWYVARGVEVEVASQGITMKEALVNLEEALELYFEDEKNPKSSLALPNLHLETLFPTIQYA